MTMREKQILARAIGIEKEKEKILLSLHSFRPLKNIHVVVGTAHRKPEYLEMRRTYA